MNPISERDLGALADAVRRRHRGSGISDADLDALDRHSFRVLTLADDLAEGESLNALDYQVVRVAAALHDAAAARVRNAAGASASAALAEELLRAVGADVEFVEAVSQAIHRHGGLRVMDTPSGPVAPLPETHAEMIVHDACLLARMEEAAAAGDTGRLADASKALHCGAARRLAAQMMDLSAPQVAAELA